MAGTSNSAISYNNKVMKKASSETWSGSDGEKQKQTAVQMPCSAAQQTRPGSNMDKNQEQGQMDDQINEEQLRRIEAMFHEADTDRGGGLDMEEFREAFKKIMGDVEDEDLDIIFMKVDTNCDNTVDWDEYVNYMLLEYHGKDLMQEQNLPLYFPEPLKIVPVAHSKPIVRLQFYPFQTVEKKGLDEWVSSAPNSHLPSGRYLSISQDGILNYWSESFVLTRTVKLYPLRKQSRIWITDMVCLSNLSLLGIASTGRDIEFYNISASNCDHVTTFSLTGLEGNVMVMNYWSDGSKGVFSVADEKGCLSVFISFDVMQNGLFNTAAFKTGSNCRVSVSALLKNTSKLYLCFKVALHDDWCQQVRYLPKLNSVASCCASDHTAMVLTTVPHSRKAKIHKSIFQVRKGILCFDYSPEFKILVTGGIDQIVRVWNPYITKAAMFQMEGHLTAIISIAINSQDSRIISVSKDKNVCVWDLHQCVCLQNIPSKNIALGQLPISSVHYNKDTNSLILATSLIGVFYGIGDDLCPELKLKKTSHEQHLCAALYNSNFKQVVSGCHNGVVSVWNILTGEKVMQFQTSPKPPVAITAMAFDGPKRRLITGSKDGTVRLWNFNNGALLLTLPLLDANEITGIIYIHQRIYVTGWSKRVIWYLDGQKKNDKMEYQAWNQYHADNIYSMHAHSNKILVTASYSGDIVVWHMPSGQAIFRFNATESPRPLLPSQVESPCSKKKSLNKSSPPQLNKHTLSTSTAEALEKSQHTVEKVLLLRTRESSSDTAILLTSAADGYVYAWSIHLQGGLLGKFCAVYNEGAAISSMSTDSQDQMLLTGDSKGYITLWDIESYCYCMRESRDTPVLIKRSVHLPSLIPKYCQIEGPRKMTPKQKTKDLDGWTVSLTPPPLLSSWRGHLRSIVSLEYVERFQLIVTASHDCNVRLWTIAGSYIGTFGQTLWCVGNPEAYPMNLPVDLRRFGSFQTLKVLNRGTQPHWKRVLEILIQWRKKTIAMSVFGKKVALHVTEYSTEQIEENWKEWEERCNQESVILGSAYKQEVRHRRPSCPTKLQTSSLEQLLPIDQFPMPKLLKELLQKIQEGADSQGKLKHTCKPGPRMHDIISAVVRFKKPIRSKQDTKASGSA